MIDDGHSQEGLFDAIGGAAACRKLAAAFYARVDHDPILRPLYGAGSHHCAIDALGNFFIQFFGGPNEYSRRRYWLSLREAHARFSIGPIEGDAWLKNIAEAMSDIRIEEPVRSALFGFFTRASTDLINQPQALKVTEPPHGDPAILDGTEGCWAVQSALDEIVAAVRAGDAVRAVTLAEASSMRTYLLADRAALVGILALAGCSGIPALTQYVNRVLAAHPDLVHDRHYNGRTLAHDAASHGNSALLETLLSLGADPNAVDDFGHSPLYCAGNEKGNESVIGVLVAAGADVDAKDNVKNCAPLHMVARRGNIPVAKALLDSGANIEVRDRKGETPLRRAVNCRKQEMAAFLLSRGADPEAEDCKGITPSHAAFDKRMSALFLAHSSQ